MKHWIVRAVVIGALGLLAGCNGDDLISLDPNDYPLNPANPQEGARNTARWSEFIVAGAEKAAALVAEQEVDTESGCVDIDGDAASGATLTFNSCETIQDGDPVTVDGTLELEPVTSRSSTASYDLTVDDDVASSNTPYRITGDNTLRLADDNNSVTQTGITRVRQDRSNIEITTDLTYPVGPVDSEDRIPTGTVESEFDTIGLTLLHVTMNFDGDETVDVVVNGQDFVYNLTTGTLVPA